MKDNEHMGHEIDKNLPRSVALSWGMVKQPQRGPKRELSIEQIVESAISIADKEGLSAVSMNRVASHLGFTAMSLYRYIPSKDDLLMLMQDAACAVAIPPEEKASDWRESMREVVQAITNIYRNHPWYGDIPIYGVPIMPNNLQIVDWSLRTMRNFPLDDHEKMSIVLLLSNYARAFGMITRDIDRAIQSGVSPETFSGLDYTPALKQLVSSERFPDLHSVVMSGAYTDEFEDETTINDFDFGLERVLDGIERFLDLKMTKGVNAT